MPSERVGCSRGDRRSPLGVCLAVRRLGLVGVCVVMLCSCQENVSDYASGAGGSSPGITIAPADTARIAPSARLPDSQPETQTAADDFAGEYPLQENPLAGCSICHVDVEDEFVGTLHFEEKVGCSTCHGPSEGHLADENNEVKPDEVFARFDVDRLCERCHECPRPASETPELMHEGEPKVCTDCHGPHDLAFAAEVRPPGSP